MSLLYLPVPVCTDWYENISFARRAQKDARDCSEEYFGWKTDRFVRFVCTTISYVGF
jgi:hypothetical protein